MTAFWDVRAEEPPADPTLGTLEDWVDAIWPHLDVKPGGHVLDLGCGPGRLLAPMALLEPDARFYGVDLNAAALRKAEQAGMPPNVQLVRGSGRSVPAGNVRFDAAWSVLLFQHLPPAAVSAYLASVHQYLQPGAPFRWQFVATNAGTPVAYGPYDWHYPAEWMVDEALAAGLEQVDVEEGRLHWEWCWATGRKP